MEASDPTAAEQAAPPTTPDASAEAAAPTEQATTETPTPVEGSPETAETPTEEPTAESEPTTPQAGDPQSSDSTPEGGSSESEAAAETADPTPAADAAAPESTPPAESGASDAEATDGADAGTDPTSEDSEEPSEGEHIEIDIEPDGEVEITVDPLNPHVHVQGGGSEAAPPEQTAPAPASGPGSPGWVDDPTQTGSTGFASGGGDITGGEALTQHVDPIAGEGDPNAQPGVPSTTAPGDPTGASDTQ